MLILAHSILGLSGWRFIVGADAFLFAPCAGRPRAVQNSTGRRDLTSDSRGSDTFDASRSRSAPPLQAASIPTRSRTSTPLACFVPPWLSSVPVACEANPRPLDPHPSGMATPGPTPLFVRGSRLRRQVDMGTSRLGWPFWSSAPMLPRRRQAPVGFGIPPASGRPAQYRGEGTSSLERRSPDGRR